MKKTKITLLTQLTALFCLLASVNLMAQISGPGVVACPAPGSCAAPLNNARFAGTPGSFPNEVGWQLINTGTNTTVACELPGGAMDATACLNLTAATSYEFRAFDCFGDGWNGATAQLFLDRLEPAAGTLWGYSAVSIFGPTTYGAGSQITNVGNTCPGPTAAVIANGYSGSTFFTTTTIAPTATVTNFPGDVTISSSPTGVVTPATLPVNGGAIGNGGQVCVAAVCPNALVGSGFTFVGWRINASTTNITTATLCTSTLVVGVHKIIAIATETATGRTIQKAFCVTVQASAELVKTCPANTTVTLDPGECKYGYNFDACFSSCAGFTILSGSLPPQIDASQINSYPGIMFDLKNNTGTPLPITAFTFARYTLSGIASNVHTYTTYVTPTTYVGKDFTPGAWTVASGPTNVTMVGTGQSDVQTLPLTTINIPAGGSIGVYITTPSTAFASGGRILLYQNANSTRTSAGGQLTQTAGIVSFPLFAFTIANWTSSVGANFNIAVNTVCTSTPGAIGTKIIQVAGVPSGSLLNANTTTNFNFKATDDAGQMATCSWSVTVKEYPENAQVDELVCNDKLHVSLDANCEAIILPDMVLEGGPYGCYETDYTVKIYTAPGVLLPGSPKITKTQVGKTLIYQVIDNDNPNNVCWGELVIEDKLPPKLVCDTVYVPCDFDLTPGNSANVTKKVVPTVPLPAALADATVVGDFTFNVSGLPPTGVTASFDIGIQHNWIGLLQARLVAPNGTVVRLWENVGKSGQTPATNCWSPVWMALAANTCDNLEMSFFDASLNANTILDTYCSTTSQGCGQNGNAPVAYAPPFAASGDFRPIVSFASAGPNYNGVWKLELRHGPTFSGVTGASPHRLMLAALKFKYVLQLYNPDPFTVDACSFSTINYTDKIKQNDCSNPYWQQISRTWSATDASGNKAVCTQQIFIIKADAADVVFPPNHDDSDAPAFDCKDAYPGPDVAGFPGGVNCTNIGATYNDEVIDVCQNSYKIIRHWTVLEWCSKAILKKDQIIKVLDKTAPVITCPSASSIQIEYYEAGIGKNPCEAHVVLPWPIVADDCSTFNNIDVQLCTTLPDGSPYCVKDNGSGVFEMDLPLPAGMFTYTFTYEAIDDCGNKGTCSIQSMIADIEEPVAVCEKNFVVSLTDSVTLVKAETFDDGSYDDCSAVTFLARRMDNPACNFCYGSDATSLAPTVPFYCCDAKGGPVMVVLRVRDAKGNFNECMVEVNVFDKIRPLITCPPDITLVCGSPYVPKGLNNIKGASGTYSAAPVDIKTINNCDTLHFWKHPHQKISNVYAKKYYVPIDITGAAADARIEDVDLSLKIDHEAVNQLKVTLWAPDGTKATVINKDGCVGATPNWYPEDIDVTLNDQAYDIDYYNTWKNILCDDPFIPAYYTCTTTLPSVGSFNYGHMRPQGDHLKVFNGHKINSTVSKNQCFTVGNSLYPLDYIDPNTNRMSSNQICQFIGNLGLVPGDKVILKYAQANGGTLGGLTVGWPYLFKVIDGCTLEFLTETGADITSVPAGSTHMFCTTDTWILVVEDCAPIGGGELHSVGLHIAYTRPVDALPKVSDNAEECGLMVSYQDLDKPDECNSMVVRRQWRVADMFGNNRSCIQRINFVDNSKLYVQFPCDVTINCEDQYDLTKVGDVIHNGDCELVGVKYDDHVLPINGGDGCIKIHRLWKVINWCEYDEFDQHTDHGTEISPTNPFDVDTAREWYPNTPWHDNCPPKKDKQTGQQVLKYPNNPAQIWCDDDGYFLYLQEIVILDQKAPVFTDCAPKEWCNYSADCGPLAVELKQSATDNCEKTENLHFQYWIDAFSDGTTDIQGVTNDASGTYPNGVHTITWKVTDACNNTNVCTYKFTIKDCKKPTPVVVGLNSKSMPNNCMLVIWASDWEKSSYDNCTPHDKLKICVVKGKDVGGVYPETPGPDLCKASATFDSTETGTQSVAIYVGDEAGNWDHAVTYVVIDAGDCGGTQSTITINGDVKTEKVENVEQAEIKVTGNNVPGIPSIFTQSPGTFNFPGLPMGNNYTVTPSKDIKPLNGVNTYDLVLIQKHLLNIQKLNSPYKMIAADANKSNSISVADIVELRKLILKINSNFTNNTSWRFIDKSVTLPANPFPVNPNWEVAQVVGSSSATANFVGVKVGDVDGTALANQAIGTEDRNFNGVLAMVADEQLVKAGQEYTMAIKADGFRNVDGYQFTMNFDAAKLEVVNVEGKLADMNEGNFGLTHLNEGMLTSSWNNTTTTVENGEVLFTITFRAKNDVNLSEVVTISSQLTPAESYVGGDVKDVTLVFKGSNGQVLPGTFALYQNEPNPFKDITTIGFNLPVAQTATLNVFDVAGKMVKSVKIDGKAGFNKVELIRKDITTGSGMLNYQLSTETHSATKSMIIVE